MRIAIVQFPGSNCERETSLAVSRAGMTPIPCLWNMPTDELAAMDGYIIVGGFSYEDRGRAGIIAAMHPVMQTIKQQSELGKPVLGICNGAQILVETGMVPGYQNYPLSIALTDNKRVAQGNVLGTGYYNAWVHLKPGVASNANAFNRILPANAMMQVPIAHGEGRFMMDDAMLAIVKKQGLIAWQYCDEAGQVNPEFPINPNGSAANIAAMVNHAGNVMAMMPHPERTSAGDSIFQSMRDYIASGYQSCSPAPAQTIVKPSLQLYRPNPDAHDLFVDLIINDNTAFTINQTIQSVSDKVRVKRLQHWSVHCASKTVLHQIQASGVLYNEQKEYLVDYKPKSSHHTFLIRAHEDILGLQKKQHLQHHFAIDGIESIEHGVLWQIEAEPTHLEKVTDAILNSHILYNPISHVCYAYD
ncbi:phosphoribosylformylglycinamidine synthase I [Legionella sp. W05-934-2]|uniref:phosphoribosylformylglycinamidine synthase I n=1 Tax=Legionella sp. W05-934-2 TaxID=1198649 RepID=UPI003462061B